MKLRLLYFVFGVFLMAGSASAWDDPLCSPTIQKDLIAKVKKPKPSKNYCSNVVLPAFKQLYLCLQRQLDYDGKLKLPDRKNKPDTAGSAQFTPDTSPGVQEEAELYKAYQNALTKVAIIYKDAKTNSIDKDANPEIAKFFNQLDQTDTGTDSDFIKKSNFDKLLLELQTSSNSNINSAAHISNDEIYLLRKLLTHAQDRIATTSKFEKDENKPQKHFNVDQLKKIQAAPLNRMLNAIRNGHINQNSSLVVNQKEIVSEVIKQNLNSLREIYNLSDKCKKTINNDNPQAHFQKVNYGLFLKALDCPAKNDTSTIIFKNRDLEALLHFINTNQKFNPKNLASIGSLNYDTKLDPLKYEKNTDLTFNKEFSCDIDTNNHQLVTVRNLPVNTNGTFNFNKIKCKDPQGADMTCPDAFTKITPGSIGQGLQITLPKGISYIEVDGKKCGDTSSPPAAQPAQITCKKSADGKVNVTNYDENKLTCKINNEEKSGKDCSSLLVITLDADADAKTTTTISRKSGKESDSLDSLSIKDQSGCDNLLPKPTPPVPPAPPTSTDSCPVATENNEACCKKKNITDEFQTEFTALKRYTWNSKDKICVDREAVDATTGPETGTRAAPAGDPSVGMPTPSPLIQMPSPSQPFLLQGLQ